MILFRYNLVKTTNYYESYVNVASFSTSKIVVRCHEGFNQSYAENYNDMKNVKHYAGCCRISLQLSRLYSCIDYTDIYGTGIS